MNRLDKRRFLLNKGNMILTSDKNFDSNILNSIDSLLLKAEVQTSLSNVIPMLLFKQSLPKVR